MRGVNSLDGFRSLHREHTLSNSAIAAGGSSVIVASGAMMLPLPPLLRELLRPRRRTLAMILAAMLVQMDRDGSHAELLAVPVEALVRTVFRIRCLPVAADHSHLPPRRGPTRLPRRGRRPSPVRHG